MNESADLNAVKQQFLEAEQRLRELAQGAVELTRASVMLKKARMGLKDGAEGLRDLSERLSEYIGSLAGVTETLSRATGALDTVGSEETHQRLAALEQQLTSIQSSLDGLQGSQTGQPTLEPFGELAQERIEALDSKVSRLVESIDAAEEQRRREVTSSASIEPTGPTRQETLERIEQVSQQVSALAVAVSTGPPSSVQDSSSANHLATHSRLEALERVMGSVQERLGELHTTAKVGTPPASDQLTQTKLDALGQGLDALRAGLAKLQARAANPASGTSFSHLEKRLSAIQATLNQTGRIARTSPGETASQMGLYAGDEDALDALGRDLRSMETTQVDLIAELRRSLGREFQRNHEELGSFVGNQIAHANSSLSRLSRVGWWLAAATFAIAGGVLYLIFFG